MGIHPLTLSKNGLRKLASNFRIQMLNLSSSACRRQEITEIRDGKVIRDTKTPQAPKESKESKEEMNAKETSSEEAVVFESLSGGKGLIKLNRPKQLNTLNYPMVCQIRKNLLEWKDNKYFILLKGKWWGVLVASVSSKKGAGEKAFCAGGDVVAVTKDKSGEAGRLFFKEEYKLDALISSLKIPFASIISGIVMGGGVGISRFGKYRIATETSMFAMPETQIGFFPDVGVSYHLARMPDHLGDFLALTGYRLKGYDLVHAGVATHFCSSNKLKELEEALVSDFAKSCSSTPEEVLKEFHEESMKSYKGQPPFSLAEHSSAMNSWFSGPTLEDVMQKISSDKSKFAQETLGCLKKMSPLSLKVTFKQIRDAEKLDIFECFNVDYRIALKMLKCGDFTEGVRALLIDKDKNPKWKHTEISKVTSAEVDQFFSPIDPDEELNLPESLLQSSS